MSRSLSLLVDSVTDELGDVASLVSIGVIERAINEGQTRMEPMVLLEVATDFGWSALAGVVTLPDDLYELVRLEPDEDHRYIEIRRHRKHANALYFKSPSLVEAWDGTLFYRAHYPTITADQDCLLPDSAADGLVSYALYKVYKRIASNRTDYRKFSTLVNNATSVGDLLDLSNTHLQDWADARDSAQTIQEVEPFYEEDR